MITWWVVVSVPASAYTRAGPAGMSDAAIRRPPPTDHASSQSRISVVPAVADPTGRSTQIQIHIPEVARSKIRRLTSAPGSPGAGAPGARPRGPTEAVYQLSRPMAVNPAGT